MSDPVNPTNPTPSVEVANTQTETKPLPNPTPIKRFNPYANASRTQKPQPMQPAGTQPTGRASPEKKPAGYFRTTRALKAAETELGTIRPLAEKAKRYEATLKEHAQEVLKSVTPEWREFLTEVAGDDPQKLLAQYNKAKARGLIGNPNQPSPTVQPKTGATTAPPQTPAQPPVDGDHAIYNEWQNMVNRGQRSIAAAFRLQNGTAIERHLKKSNANPKLNNG